MRVLSKIDKNMLKNPTKYARETYAYAGGQDGCSAEGGLCACCRKYVCISSKYNSHTHTHAHTRTRARAHTHTHTHTHSDGSPEHAVRGGDDGTEREADSILVNTLQVALRRIRLPHPPLYVHY